MVWQHVLMAHSRRYSPILVSALVFLVLVGGAASGLMATSAVVFLLVLGGFMAAMAVAADRYQRRWRYVLVWQGTG